MSVLLIGLFAAGLVNAAPEKKIIDGVTYHILEASPDSVEVIWQGEDGKPLATFPKAFKHLKDAGKKPLTLMNGGIFEPGLIPSGLLIQDGKELTPINRKPGKGNFFLQPNGVFMVGEGKAAVIATPEYPLKDFKVHSAVQSGPLLLRHGKIHPKFNKDSGSRLTRNGVGVTKEGEVVFAMTDFHSPKLPNLYEFAALFAKLGCDDALFLDGDLSQMRSGKDMERFSNRFGSFIAVLDKGE